MTRPNVHQALACLLLLSTCSSCNSEMAKQDGVASRALSSEMAQETEPSGSLHEVELTSNDKTLELDEIDLFLDVVKKNESDLPELIEVSFRNKSPNKGCLALPRPVVEDTDYNLSRPCLGVVTSALFLFATPKDSSHQPLTGVHLEPGEEIKRQYKLSSFCVVGHGIGPKPSANFQACYSAGDIQNKMQVWVITNWDDIARIASNDIEFQASELDLSARFNEE